MRIFLALVLLATSAGNIVAGQAGHADQLVQQLGRGINVLGYDPIWKDPSKAHFQPGDYKMLHDSGFQHIRVNLQAFSHMDAADKLDLKWLETLDSVIEQATEAGLLVILDEHDFQFCGRGADECRSKLLAFWRQIGPRYRNAPASVLFEILNEPNRAMTPDLWNGLLSETLALIRQTNPTRGVVIGPANSNNFRSLDALVLPTTDRNIIVTVHYYDPFPFTHQGATWTVPSRERLIGVPWGTDADHQTIVRNFSNIAAWSKAHDRPILLGEFGSYDKADMAARVAWTSAVARTAERDHFAWSYWQFESSFSAYDIANRHWIEPIYDALIPKTTIRP
ncbi:glycoside hydrolase family 5 protein [Rhizobium sp. rho-13.1]|nr:cellulase family glycosylhydrolase [Rhizobium sp. rho-13.1]TQX83443.1 glycoside hydrolase family 5 protein [Rhizobium sp. rho-13.1]TQY07042.1 glycoside hydrolase family 5 protein [Rhizobium sp. rho-1.1]